jgi:hypothetical protein
MATTLFANNAVTTLAVSMTSTSQTTIQVTDASKFPTPTAGQYFLITMIPASSGIPGEIMQVTNVSGTTLTVVRAQEGTTAAIYSALDIVSNQLTAGSLSNFIQSGVNAPNRVVTVSTTLAILSTDNNGTIGLNRTSGVTAMTANLPSGVTAPYRVTLADLSSNFNSAPVTVVYPSPQTGPNGATSAVLSVNKSRTTFEFFGGTTNSWSGP